MRNVPPDKYNVAWFKLAECVSRGEKERALGVYRLLAHSFQDSAFTRQLQGDLLLSFNDTAAAVEQYRTAANIYKKTERFLQAAAMYEHILQLVSDKREPLIALVELYSLLRTIQKVLIHATPLFELLIDANIIDEPLRIMNTIDALLLPQETVLIRQALIIALAKKNAPQILIELQVEKAIEQFVRGEDTQALQRFLSLLETVNPAAYEQAWVIVQKTDL